MGATLYSTRAWRELPRDGPCVVRFLFDEAAGPCAGLMHRHHVIPGHSASRSVQVCASHHPKLEAALRLLVKPPELEWVPCPHKPGTHVYEGARESCERNLNRQRRRERQAA